MAKKVKRKTLNGKAKRGGPSRGLVYLTTRALKRAIAKGTKNERSEALSLLGYTVIEKEGWVVKEFADGHIERISKIAKVKRRSRLVLD
jgi:hypothetical protein